ncbi:hypothetical protein ABFX02_06G143300 [Erythranthe guttata]
MGSQYSEKAFEGDEYEYDSDNDCGCGILFYDRDNPGSGEPNGLQYFQSMVKLAIDFYNKDKSEKYRVVELIKLFGIANAGAYLYLNFTAKLDDSDPVPFKASIFDGIIGTNIQFVGMDDEAAI